MERRLFAYKVKVTKSDGYVVGIEVGCGEFVL